MGVFLCQEIIGQLESARDFGGDEALVGKTHRLVMHPLVQVAL
ncbi:unannotated protein [freshwater metagenome]|uniref:Unannotated protein n=1 Tax=freshwater metagenome TaxID=449393 RepID=A0A6J7HAH8_9ZZZZ